jgi:hypothetical protein
MKRPSLLTAMDQKPLKMVTLAPLPPAPVRKNRGATAIDANAEASPVRNAAAVLVVAFVFWAVYFLMNHLAA